MLRFTGSQRVRHDWVTELNWTEARKMGSSCSKDPNSTQWFSGEGFQRQYEGGGCRLPNQLVLNSRISWRQGEISSIVSLLVLTELGSTWFWSAVFIWWGSGFCKDSWGMCVRPLSVSLREWEFGNSVMWLISRPTWYQFPSPAASLLFPHVYIPNSGTSFWDSGEAPRH